MDSLAEVQCPDQHHSTTCNPRPPSPSPQPLFISGNPSIHTPNAIEFVFDESQSNIGGRQGSNACCFIALYMGRLVHTSCLTWPKDASLAIEWKHVLRSAMLNGNAIHDDLFDFDAVNIQVDDAVVLAGDECKVNRVSAQMDFFGHNPINQLKDYIKDLAQRGPLPTYCVLSAHGLTVLLVVNIDGNGVIIDSHTHGSNGAMVAFCKAQHVSELGSWYAGMLQEQFSTVLTIGSLSRIEYINN